MPMSTGRAKIFNAHKVLRGHWDKVQEVWDDSVRRDFGETVWEPLTQEVQSVLQATDQIDHILGEMFRDCE